MNPKSISETSNAGARSAAFVHALAVALLLALAVGTAPANIDPAEDISAVIPIKPSEPMGQFPNHGDDERLAPNYTFTVDVQVTDQEQIGNAMWVRVGPVTATASTPDPNLFWTAAANTTIYRLTNTATTTGLATLTVKCTWRRLAAGGGQGPAALKDGSAASVIDLLDSVVHWEFGKTIAYADGDEELTFSYKLLDEAGRGLERWDVAGYSPDDPDPGHVGWHFDDKIGQEPWERSVDTLSFGEAARASIRLDYNDGSSQFRVSEDQPVFFLIESVTPAGDPVDSPQEFGQGRNEFTFSGATPGVLTIEIEANVVPAGIAAEVADKITLEVDDIGDSEKAWAVESAGGKPVPIGDSLFAFVTFTGLPANSTDFGAKILRIHYDESVVVEQDYEVFFPKNAENHPEHGPYPGPRPPNWYYYWAQTSANLSNTTMIFVGEVGSTYSFAQKTIRLGTDASTGTKPAWGSPFGIDFYTWATGHEAKHHTQLTGFWPDGYIAADDDDGDWIPNDQEATYMPGRNYEPQNPATFLDEIGYGFDPLAPIPDIEDIAMRSQVFPYGLDELWTNGSANNEDWANPGKNSKNSF